MKKALTLLLLLTSPTTLMGFTVEQQLETQQQEARAKALFQDIRCSVCDGQAIASSNSQTAISMRSFVRKQIREGKSDEEIITTLIRIYGDDIYMKPPINSSTLPLWIMPFILILLGIMVIFMQSRKEKTAQKE